MMFLMMLPLSCLAAQETKSTKPKIELTGPMEWLNFETRPCKGMEFIGDPQIASNGKDTWHECTGGLPTFIEKWCKDLPCIKNVGGYEKFLLDVKKEWYTCYVQGDGSRRFGSTPRIFEMFKYCDYEEVEKAYILRPQPGSPQNWVLEEFCIRKVNPYFTKTLVQPHKVLYRFHQDLCHVNPKGETFSETYEPRSGVFWYKLPFPTKHTQVLSQKSNRTGGKYKINFGLCSFDNIYEDEDGYTESYRNDVNGKPILALWKESHDKQYEADKAYRTGKVPQVRLVNYPYFCKAEKAEQQAKRRQKKAVEDFTYKQQQHREEQKIREQLRKMKAKESS